MTAVWIRLRSLLSGAPPRVPIHVTLWGKADCSLCDKALVVLERLSSDYPLVIQKRDIVGEPDVYDRYRYVIPVVDIANGPTFSGKITEYRLSRAFEDMLLRTTVDRPHRDRSALE
jgi:hypothetical protein